jgi:hypothetical protein
MSETLQTTPVPADEWKWFGNAGHFICGRWCRFHLCTQVGPWLISTVGEYVHPRHSAGGEKQEAAYLMENPLGEEIGCGRKFETMVFEAGPPCRDNECNCGLPKIASSERDAEGYNDRGSATKGHLSMCQKWAALAPAGGVH